MTSIGAHLVLNPSCVCRYRDKSSIHYPSTCNIPAPGTAIAHPTTSFEEIGPFKIQGVKWHSKVSETFQSDDFHIPTCILLCAEIIAAIWIDSSSVHIIMEKHKYNMHFPQLSAWLADSLFNFGRKHWTKGTTSSQNRHIRPLIWLRHHWINPRLDSFFHYLMRFSCL